MPLFGSHLSVAGGYYKAVEAAAALGLDTVQIFTGPPRQFPRRASDEKAVSDEQARKFKTALAEHGLQAPCAHDSYLLNLGTPSDDLWRRSIDGLTVEFERAETLGLSGLVLHPGSYVGSSEAAGLARIVEALDEVHRRTAGFQCETWLECTAGQGTNLGHRFEHLATILTHLQDSSRCGVCLDTCHLFAAGYSLGSKQEYTATMAELDDLIGLERVRAFHLNDSKSPLGSRVDRHEHIGEGHLGLEPFRFILNDSRFAALPMYLETKKEQRDGEEMDAVNLRVLKSLLKNKPKRSPKKGAT